MSDANDPADPASREGWLFPSPVEASDTSTAPGPRRLGKGLLTLLDEANDVPVDAPEGPVAVFGPGSVIQLSSCAEGEPEYESPPAPVAATPAQPPSPPAPAPQVIDEPVVDEPVVDEPVVDEQIVDEPAVEPGPAVLIDDEVFGLELPDVELE